jgi:hypothetical protein
LSADEVKASATVTVEQGQVFYSKKFMEGTQELQDQIALKRKYKKGNTYERRFCK